MSIARRSSNSAPWATSSYDIALQNTLPTRTQGFLLAACLREPEVASEAWRDFIASVGDPKRFFEMDRNGLKGLLPFVESRLTANGIDAGRAFHTYARVASVREALRSRIYLEILGKVLDVFAAAGISSILLKGGALSATVYPQPSWRHNHAIDLWVEAGAMARSSSVLRAEQFIPEQVGPGAVSHGVFRHVTGLVLGLHSRPLYLPHFDLPLEEIGARIQTIEVGERRAHVMSPEDALVHVLGHAIYSRSRSNLRWVCDVFYLIERNPSLDWKVVTRTATRARLALPLLVLLRSLKETLAARIPNETLDELADRNRLDGVEAEGIYAALLHTSTSPREAFGWTKASLRTLFGFARFGVLPSRRYMSWRYNARRWKLPYYYVARPSRFAARSLSRIAARGSARSNPAAGGTTVQPIE